MIKGWDEERGEDKGASEDPAGEGRGGGVWQVHRLSQVIHFVLKQSPSGF